MLSIEDNELMCRVGPRTPMGSFLRQYWLPSTVPSTLLPAPDCPPIRVRLLGEDLIAFRTTSGRVGMVTNACPHRGASLFFGRNEEEGLRCVYHGWKFDVDGACVDMPSEPAESNFRSKVRVAAYPCIERNGMIWTYMGPRTDPPPLPDFEFNTSPPEMCYHPGFVFYDCNWVQSMEGDIDSAHIDYLHSRLTPEAPPQELVGFGQAMWNKDRTPNILAYTMEYGAVYAGQRRWDEAGNNHYRIAQFLLPFYTMIPRSGAAVAFNAWVPLDDDHTVQISFRSSIREPAAEDQRLSLVDPYTRLGGYLPATSDPMTRWRSPANRGNDYLISYENQRTVMFSGIPREGKLQDIAVMESMGAIGARAKEHLGRSDTMIIIVRRSILNAAKALETSGEIHRTVDNPGMYRVRSAEVLLPPEQDWFDATEAHRRSDGGVRIKNFVTAELV
jgi:nitrite reductase/ring-hydroxylating ferredoxin subunit